MSAGKITATLRTGGTTRDGLEAMITETAEDARRLGLADTLIRGFQPEISTATSLAPSVTASLTPSQIAAVVKESSRFSVRRTGLLFASLVIISAGTFLYLFPHSGVIAHKAPVQAASFSVSAIDPAAQGQAIAPAIQEQAEVQPAVSPKLPIAGAAGKNFAYAREPRLSGAPSFGTMQSSASSARRATGGSALQAVPGNQGRFLSRSGLQWQGAWENSNPAGNIKRAEGYMQYLRSQFSSDASRSLVSRQTGLGLQNPPVQAPPLKDLPVLKYSK